MISTPALSLPISHTLTEVGALAAFAALIGIALLALLFFAQARELKRLREWAGSAPERFTEIERQLAAERAAQAQRQLQTTGTRVVPRMSPVISRAATAATVAARPPGPAAPTQPGGVGGTGSPGVAPPLPAPTGEHSVNGAAGAPGQPGAPAQSGVPAQQAAAKGQVHAEAEGESAEKQGEAGEAAAVAQGAGTEQGSGAEKAADGRQTAEGAHPSGHRQAGAAEQGAGTEEAPAKPTPAAVPATAAARSNSRVSAAFPGAPTAPTAPVAGAAAAAGAAAGAAAAVGAGAASGSPAPAGPRAPGEAPGSAPGGPPANGQVPGSTPPDRVPPAPASVAGGATAPPRDRLEDGEPVEYKHLREGGRGSRGVMAAVGAGVLVLAVAAVAVVLLVGGGGSKGHEASGSSQTGQSKPKGQVQRISPGHTTVTVLNSTEVDGLAGHTSGKLREAGYVEAKPSFGDPNGSYPDTVVMYSRGHAPAARGVGKAIGVGDVEPMSGAVRGLVHGSDVAVVVGENQAEEGEASEGAGEGEGLEAGEG